MLSRSVVRQARTYATLREIEGRLKSIKNIEKITQTMKTVASTKLNKAQRAMETARAYGKANDALYKNAETSQPDEGKTLYIVCSSDKGLCGGIHSSMTKFVRRATGEDANNAKTSIVVLGDKSKAQLSRSLSKAINLSFANVGKDIPTFADAQAIADEIFKSGIQFDKIEVVYNAFKSAIAYETEVIQAYDEKALENSPNFPAFELEDDVLENLKEFALANAIYWGLAEGHACEISARRNAMENASKSAGDMIQRFSLLYNRTRQSVITTELIDIIVGATAQEG